MTPMARMRKLDRSEWMWPTFGCECRGKPEIKTTKYTGCTKGTNRSFSHSPYFSCISCFSWFISSYSFRRFSDDIQRRSHSSGFHPCHRCDPWLIFLSVSGTTRILIPLACLRCAALWFNPLRGISCRSPWQHREALIGSEGEGIDSDDDSLARRPGTLRSLASVERPLRFRERGHHRSGSVAPATQTGAGRPGKTTFRRGIRAAACNLRLPGERPSSS